MVSRAEVLSLDGPDRPPAGTDDEELLVELDEVLSPGDVLARIEDVVATLVEDVTSGREPTLQLVSRASSNRTTVATQPGNAALGLRDQVQTRSLLAKHGQGAFAFARVFGVLELVHELVRSGRQATQRDIYYKLIGTAIFASAHDVTNAIQDCISLLRVPRTLLGITCASRGAVAGMIMIKDGPMNPWQDCSTCDMGGRAIPGNIQTIEAMGLRSNARWLLVIEKDAIFQTLVQDRFFDLLPCVMVTAKGQPDVATRAFCSKLASCVPTMQVLGLVDYNPSGVLILKTYKHGSHTALESHRYTLPDLKWLGLRGSLMASVQSSGLRPLSSRDNSLFPGLLSTLTSLGETRWCQEVQQMSERKVKADIEALYGAGVMSGMATLLAQAVLRGDFI